MKNGNEVAARVVDAFEKLDVEYLLAGSFSSNFYGIPRSTKDADFVAVLSGKLELWRMSSVKLLSLINNPHSRP